MAASCAARIGLVAFFLLVLVYVADSERMQQKSMRRSMRSRRTSRRAMATSSKDPSFTRPSFLIMSSPMEQKVSYVQLENFIAKGLTHPLVDSGLTGPSGIAYDAKHSFLYVADIAQRTIISYTIVVELCTTSRSDDCASDPLLTHSLAVVDAPLVVVENTLSSWVAVNDDGDLFFTDQDKTSVNRLSYKAIKNILESVLSASTMKTISAAEVGSLATADSAQEAHKMKHAAETAAAENIIALFDADSSSHVSLPAGVTSDGVNIYWVNQANGLKAGSLMSGSTAPKVDAIGGEGATTDSSIVKASNTDASYGVAITYNAMVYTDDQGMLYALSRGGSAPIKMAKGFESPRGIVWDGDNTLFVADQTSNSIYSLPCGRLGTDVAIALAVSIRGPFGITLLKGSDPAYMAASLPPDQANTAYSTLYKNAANRRTSGGAHAAAMFLGLGAAAWQVAF